MKDQDGGEGGEALFSPLPAPPGDGMLLLAQLWAPRHAAFVPNTVLGWAFPSSCTKATAVRRSTETKQTGVSMV